MHVHCCTDLWLAIGDDMASLPVIGSEPARRGARRILAGDHPGATAAGAPLRAARSAADVIAGRRRGSASAEDETSRFNWVRQTARRVGNRGARGAGALRPRRADTGAGAAAPAAHAGIATRALGVDGEAARAGASVRWIACAPRWRRARAAGCSIPRTATPVRNWRFRVVRAGQIINAVIDRTFVDAQGTAGWSTSRPVRTRAATQRLPRLRSARATRRICGVMRTWRAAGPEPVRAGLYSRCWPRGGKWTS
jgi:hypothetical protein